MTKTTHFGHAAGASDTEVRAVSAAHLRAPKATGPAAAGAVAGGGAALGDPVAPASWEASPAALVGQRVQILWKNGRYPQPTF